MAEADLNRINKMVRATFASSLGPKLKQPVLDIATKYGPVEHPIDAARLGVHE